MPVTKTRTNTLIAKPRAKDLAPSLGLDHEQAAEVHAIRRLSERYAHAGITADTAAETMIDHLAMLLAGQSEYRSTSKHSHHLGNEVHRIRWNGHWIYLSYDPRIMRIVTYLPPTRYVENMVHHDVRKKRVFRHADD